jgi:hypothetical protein
MTRISRSALSFSCALIMSITASASHAQNTASGVPAAPFEARGAFAAIVLLDFEASIRWYQANLGLRLLKRSRSPRVAAESAVLQGHNFFLELIPQDCCSADHPRSYNTYA